MSGEAEKAQRGEIEAALRACRMVGPEGKLHGIRSRLREAFGFMAGAALVAESMNHHPNGPTSTHGQDRSHHS